MKESNFSGIITNVGKFPRSHGSMSDQYFYFVSLIEPEENNMVVVNSKYSDLKIDDYVSGTYYKNDQNEIIGAIISNKF